jgi:hypothetical protein
MVYGQQIRAVDPIRLAEISGVTKIRRFAAPTPPVVRPFLLTHQLRGCCCGQCGGHGGMALPPDYGTLRGLGQDFNPPTQDLGSLQVPSVGTGNISILQTAAVGASFIPGIGQIGSVVLSSLNQMLNKFESWFHIGAGRREADIIVPVQNQLMQFLGTVTNRIILGNDPSVSQLDQMYRDVWTHAVGFQEFVLMRNFVDRRASGQALNTVMPYIDGTCGYPVPVGYQASPGRSNCLSWGDGTIGGVGTDGMLGAIARAMGGAPPLPDLHQAANQGVRPNALPGPSTYPGPTSYPGPSNYPGPTPYPSPSPLSMGISTPLMFLLGIGALMLYKRGL